MLLIWACQQASLIKLHRSGKAVSSSKCRERNGFQLDVFDLILFRVQIARNKMASNLKYSIRSCGAPSSAMSLFMQCLAIEQTHRRFCSPIMCVISTT
jgi:uncharacterized protein YjhX (UPF0386 family)